MLGEKIQDINDLWERIFTTVGTVTPDMLVNTWREVEYRLGDIPLLARMLVDSAGQQMDPTMKSTNIQTKLEGTCSLYVIIDVVFH